MEQIITSFVNRSFEVAQWCLDKKIIPVEDLISMESHIFMSIPALTVYEMLIKSKQSNSLQLSAGGSIDAETAPEQVKVITKQLMKAFVIFKDLRYDDLEEEVYKRKLVKNMMELDTTDTLYQLLPQDKELYSEIMGATIMVTQNEAFKMTYGEVIKLLQSMYRE
jgi:hypothetical protein